MYWLVHFNHFGGAGPRHKAGSTSMRVSTKPNGCRKEDGVKSAGYGDALKHVCTAGLQVKLHNRTPKHIRRVQQQRRRDGLSEAASIA